MRVLDEGKAFDAWQKLSGLTSDAKSWVSKSKELLKRVNSEKLTDAQVDKLKEFYQKSYTKHSSCIPPCVKSTAYGDIEFDDFGFPNFKN